MKYYRQSYIDLVLQSGFEKDYQDYCRLFVERFFDRIEIGICLERMQTSEDKLMTELQTANRIMTNEKNKYLTIFESIPNPVILLDKNNDIENMSHIAVELFQGYALPGDNYYGKKHTEKKLPWLTEEIKAFASDTAPELRFEKELAGRDGTSYFEVRLKRMLDFSEKFSGTVVILNDLTKHKMAEKAT